MPVLFSRISLFGKALLYTQFGMPSDALAEMVCPGSFHLPLLPFHTHQIRGSRQNEALHQSHAPRVLTRCSQVHIDDPLCRTVLSSRRSKSKCSCKKMIQCFRLGAKHDEVAHCQQHTGRQKEKLRPWYSLFLHHPAYSARCFSRIPFRQPRSNSMTSSVLWNGMVREGVKTG